MPSLRINLPGTRGEVTHVLDGLRITIGRRPDNTIQIIDRSVSGHHAELIVTDGHYRLHDLGSTNFTSVNGQPVTDYHLRETARIVFGKIECEFRVESARHDRETAAELIPTRGELDFLRRENLELQEKIVAQQKQIDILSSARLVTKDLTQLGVASENHRHVIAQRDELRREIEIVEMVNDNLRADLVAVTRDRDATRQAWNTLKAELHAAQHALAALRAATSREPAGAISSAG
jgi:predicted component of type VI protein secretion system